jgi:four helix bundle protein
VTNKAQGMTDKTQKSYHKLILWQKMKELLLLTYKLTEKLPPSEQFGIISQMRRAIVFVISNFVEGYMKTSLKHKDSFMEISETSLMELEGQSEVCLMLEFWTNEDYELYDKKRSEVAYFLYRYRLSLKS